MTHIEHRAAANPPASEGMRVHVLEENLKRAVRQMRRFTAKTVHPQTGNFLLTADNGRLRVEATSLDVAARTWIGARVDHEGSVSVNAAQLARFVATLSASSVTITGGQMERDIYPDRPNGPAMEVVTEQVVTLEAEGATLTLQGADPTGWPSLAAADGAVSYKLPEGWQAALRVVLPCSASDDARPVLTGVRFQVKDGRLGLAAADGFRLAMADAGPYTGEPFEANISRAGLTRLSSPASDCRTLKLQASRATFKTDQIEVTCTLVPGTLPDYESIIPTEWTTRVTASAEALWRTLQRAKVIAASGIIRLEADAATGLKVSARAAEFGSYEQQMAAAVEGVAGAIAFNVKYLQDAVAPWRAGEFVIEFRSRNEQALFYPPGKKARIVVMPMFVQW